MPSIRTPRLPYELRQISGSRARLRIVGLPFGFKRVFLGDEAADRLTESIAGGAAEHCLGCLVEESDLKTRLGNDDGVIGGVDDAGQAGLRFGQLVFRSYLPEDALDGFRQVVEVFGRLGHEIAHARAKSPDRHGLVAESGHQDHGQIEAHALHSR